MQRQFIRLAGFGAAAALAGLIVGAHAILMRLPNRVELGARVAELVLTPVSIGGMAPLRLAGAWRLRSADPRVGGISALAIDDGALLALTDSGVVIRFPKPARERVRAEVAELPDGPGAPAFKKNRDSEALARDPLGRGWWVAFENRNELWLYDPDFARALRRIRLGPEAGSGNHGIEGMIAHGGSLRLFPERGYGGHFPWNPQVSDAAVLPGGRLLIAERRATPFGFINWLNLAGRRYRLPLEPMDIIEGVAAERLSGGGTRLWLVTDNNGHDRTDTLLLAVDLPAEP